MKAALVAGELPASRHHHNIDDIGNLNRHPGRLGGQDRASDRLRQRQTAVAASKRPSKLVVDGGQGSNVPQLLAPGIPLPSLPGALGPALPMPARGMLDPGNQRENVGKVLGIERRSKSRRRAFLSVSPVGSASAAPVGPFRFRRCFVTMPMKACCAATAARRVRSGTLLIERPDADFGAELSRPITRLAVARLHRVAAGLIAGQSLRTGAEPNRVRVVAPLRRRCRDRGIDRNGRQGRIQVRNVVKALKMEILFNYGVILVLAAGTPIRKIAAIKHRFRCGHMRPLC